MKAGFAAGLPQALLDSASGKLGLLEGKSDLELQVVFVDLDADIVDAHLELQRPACGCHHLLELVLLDQRRRPKIACR